MHLEFMTRGAGKVLALLGDVPAGCALDVTAVTAEGAAVPVRVVEGPGGAPVVVMPLLSVAASVSVYGREEHGDAVDHVRFDVGPRVAKYRSRMGSALRRDLSAAVRGCDRWDRVGHVRVAWWEVMPCAGEGARLVACAEYADLSCDVPDGELRVRLLDGTARDVGVRASVTLGRVDEPMADYPGCVRRRDIVSLDVRPTDGVTCLTVGYEGAPELDEFLCVEPGEMAGRRDGGLRDHTPAWLDDGYDGWMRAHAANAIELAAQREIAGQVMGEPPVHLSLVMPVGAGDAHAVAATVASLEAQSYAAAELVLAPVGNVNVRALATSDVACALDMSGAAEGEAIARAVERCHGTHVALVAPGDTLEPDALFALGRVLVDGADAVYADEDRIDHGRYFDVRLKPDWSPVAQMCVDCVGRALFVSADLARDVLVDVRDMADARMALALALYERDADVHHVSRVLWHAAPAPEHPSDDAACAAVSAALANRDLPVACVPRTGGGRSLVLAGDTPPTAAVIVLGDAEGIAVAEPGLACEERVALERVEDLGRVVDRLTCDVVGLVAPGSKILREGWLAQLAAYALLPHVGLAAGMEAWPDGSVAAVARMITPNRLRALGTFDVPDQAHLRELGCAHEVSVVAPGAVAVRRDVLAQLLRDGAEGLAWDAWADLSLRVLSQGMANVAVPDVVATRAMDDNVVLGRYPYFDEDAWVALGSQMRRMSEPFAENDAYVNSAFDTSGHWRLGATRREPTL